MTGTVWDRIFANLVAALTGINGGATATSTVDQDVSAGERVLYLASTSGFVVGKPVMINAGGDREEITTVVSSITDGVSITLQQADYWTGFAYDHTAVQGDAVKQDWYNYTMSDVLSWSAEAAPWASTYPIASVVSEREVISGTAGAFYDLTKTASIVAWNAVEVARPNDQDNDTVSQKLLADIIKAILTDRRRGGQASDTRLIGSSPMTANDADDPECEIPLAGVMVQIEIDYKHYKDNLYF